MAIGVIAPDARAHGETVNPEGDLSFDQLARDRIAFCRHLGLVKPIVWGFSMAADTGAPSAPSSSTILP